MTVIRIFGFCCLPDCFLLLQSATHPSLFQEYFHHSPFVAVCCPEGSMHDCRHWVQLECTRINTSELIQTHSQTNHAHTAAKYLPGITCMHGLCHPYRIWIYVTCRATYGLPNEQPQIHQVVSGDTCDSACYHCCPLGCAVLHTAFTACLPSETKHLWISVVQEW